MRLLFLHMDVARSLPSDGQYPTCGVRATPSPTSTANFGESCEALPCSSSYCNPESKTCAGFPGAGEACAAEDLADSLGTRCATTSGSRLYCAADGICKVRPASGNECDIAAQNCENNRNCVERIDGGGTICALASRLGDFCSDEAATTCWRQGLNFGRVLQGWTQDLKCEGGVCAEDKGGGVGSLCAANEGVCAQTGFSCAVAQDGEKRCLLVANMDDSDTQECFKGRSYDAIALFSCPGGYTCNDARQSRTDFDYTLEFCFSDVLGKKGQDCDIYGGGVKCEAELRCSRYSATSDFLSTRERCVTIAKDGESCDGNMLAQCLPNWPSVGACENNVCSVDGSQSPPCAENQSIIQVIDPNDNSRRADVCVNYQQEQGQKCQVSAPPLGGIYQQFKCKEGQGLECRQPVTAGRFDVEGTCSIVAARGARCARGEAIVCAEGFACVNGSCQPQTPFGGSRR